ncbi:MAG: hypothetical protein CVU65_08085 [Deltaproteobacteria bacterium HGW-Deltaproteobacteria-22]|nr:MAG: hypothetical protein CVU65_08085 [Deltaproteobacteria bacterium HGW-Deltaproteobacteria-22]
MKLRNLFLLSVIVTLSFAFAACDDGEKKTNPCGNGVLDPTEECDSTNLNEQTCALVVPTRPGGTLACTPTCTFDTVGCTAPSCGNDAREGTEECDGTDLGGETCDDRTGFSGGTLGCTASCTWDTSACDVDCVVEDNFATCNPMGGANECCPNNDMPSTCFSSGDFRACLQTCSVQTDCGWSMECVTNIGNLCYVSFCGKGTAVEDVQAPCTLAGGRSGVCYPAWRAMDESGLCFENGTLEHGDVCPLADAMGIADTDPATQCNNGFCFGATGATEGSCFGKCNPIEVLATGTDACPANSACLNFSSIDLDETNTDGSVNDNFLFREPDMGVCYVWEAGSEFYSCDLLTGDVITGPNPGGPCPDGMTCNYFGLGSLLGFCYDVVATPAVEGATCTITQDAPQACAEGLQCFISDPFNDATGEALACRKICDATVLEGNEACAGLVDADDQPYVCLTTSRFFTADRELPTIGTGLNMETETSPSTLGFCVPPVALAGK